MTDNSRTLLRSFHVPFERELNTALTQFSPFERILFGILVSILAVSSSLLLYRVSVAYSVEVPTFGGSYTEGVIGSPRFINPLLAISDADKDLTSLIYSGLMRPSKEGGLVTDLAESYTVSDDGKTYTVIIRTDALFHDNTPVTADDVIYTIQKAQDPALKSPARAAWEGVTVTKRSDREIEFTLGQPFAPFLENLTLGILPKHVWEHSDNDEFPFSKFNTEPIGSGQYRVLSIERDQTGIPVTYELRAVTGHYLRPHIRTILLKFYTGEDELITALNKGEVYAVGGIRPTALFSITRKNLSVITTPLPRVFGIFFNQNKNGVFADQSVREALDLAIDKEKLVSQALLGYATIIDSPFPPSVFIPEPYSFTPENRQKALALLEARGWTKNEETGILEKGKDPVPLSFTLTTANVPELKAAAESVANDLKEIGIDAQIKIFEPSDLSLSVIRPRDFEALLFGEVVGRGLDLFAFWHSSQRNDPGLNIAGYASISADALLEKARRTNDEAEKQTYFESFNADLVKETPAIFLYSPSYVYITPQGVSGIDIRNIETGADRFDGVADWYTETELVWNFLL